MEEQATTPEAVAPFMAPTAPGAYLIIAHYDRNKWLTLSSEERKQAEKQAEAMFSEEAKSFPLREGLIRAYTFYTGIHAAIPNYMVKLSEDQREKILNPIFAEPRDKAPGTEVKDPGVGFIALVDANQLSSFAELLDNTYSPIGKMYRTQVIPLNDDQNTEDIYQLMTPVHWG